MQFISRVCLLSTHLGGGRLSASTGCCWVGGGDEEEVWSGVGQDWSLIRQGAKEGRGGSELGAAFPELCFQVLEGWPRGCTCVVTGSCGCAGTLFSPQSDRQDREGYCCLSGKTAAAALWEVARPRSRSRPVLALGPHAGWVPSETACTALKSSWRVRVGGSVSQDPLAPPYHQHPK